jgi:hypothetical protein
MLGIEASLLDALSLRTHDRGIEEASVSRFLRIHAAHLDRAVLGELTRSRYIRAMNRLRVLARDLGHDALYRATLEIIRDEGGGCYVGRRE